MVITSLKSYETNSKVYEKLNVPQKLRQIFNNLLCQKLSV